MPHKIYPLQTGRWIEIEEPTQTDLEFLRKEFPFIHPTNLEDLMQQVSRAKLDLTDRYLFLSDTVPIDLALGKRATAFELSILLTDEVIITITHQKTDLLKRERQEKDEVANVLLPNTPALLAYRFLEAVYDNSAKTIDTIERSIGVIDDNILNINSPTIIRDIAILQRNIIYFISTLNATIPYFEELEAKEKNFGEISMKEYWGDLVDKLRQQRTRLEEQDGVLSKLAKAHENIVSYHTNHVIHLLTAFSVILLPLNLVASVYGMNFKFLPNAENPHGFLAVIIVMVILAAAMVAYFKYKKYI